FQPELLSPKKSTCAKLPKHSTGSAQATPWSQPLSEGDSGEGTAPKEVSARERTHPPLVAPAATLAQMPLAVLGRVRDSGRMQKTSLTALSRELLEDALRSSSGRSSRTVFGGHERVLRQTVVTLAAGQSMTEHVNPGEATI